MVLLVLVLSRVATVLVLVIETSRDDRTTLRPMSDSTLIAFPFRIAIEKLATKWLRAAQSIPINIAEPSAGWDAEIDYDDKHRCAEHEHESEITKTPVGQKMPPSFRTAQPGDSWWVARFRP